MQWTTKTNKGKKKLVNGSLKHKKKNQWEHPNTKIIKIANQNNYTKTNRNGYIEVINLDSKQNGTTQSDKKKKKNNTCDKKKTRVNIILEG